MKKNAILAASILALGLIGAVAIVVYNSPFNTCVRAYTSDATDAEGREFVRRYCAQPGR